MVSSCLSEPIDISDLVGLDECPAGITITALRQPLRRLTLGAHVKVSDDQNIDQALLELREWIKRGDNRPWAKRRYGYYERPGELRRKQKKMKGGGTGGESFYVGPPELFAHTGPTNSVGK